METNVIVNMIKMGVGGALGVLAWVFGPMTVIYQVLLALVVIDYASGVLNAMAQKRLNSEVGFKGIARKLFIFFLVALASLIDRAFPQGNGILTTAVCGFYIANEGISILENAGMLGLPIPKVLKSALEQLRKKDEEEE